MPVDKFGHKTRYSDSSFYDETCVRCGGTDARGDYSLKHPCPGAEEAREKAVAFLASPCSHEDGKVSWGGWLIKVLGLLYKQGESFNGKRPTGNSGWGSDLDDDMRAHGVTFDDVTDALTAVLARAGERPTAAAEDGPAPVLNFGDALDALRCGKKVAREGWNGKGMWLRRVDLYNDSDFRVVEDPESIGTWMPFIVMKTADNKLVPWNASQADAAAEDWMVVA